MSRFTKPMFIALLLVVLCFDVSMPIKCVSMNNQLCLVRPTLVDLNLDEMFFY